MAKRCVGNVVSQISLLSLPAPLCADDFFSEERPHLQQELISPDDEFSSLLNASILKMPPVVIKAW